MEALLLKSEALPHNKICKITDISKPTLCKYLLIYKNFGIEMLKEVNFYKPKSELAKHASSVEEYFTEHPPASIKEAMSKIEELTGLKRSESQVSKFLKRLGMKPRKIGMIPAKADLHEQEVFKNEPLGPRLEEAKFWKRAVFFVDAAHFVLAPFLGTL